jgi:hypothetical protein
LSASSGEPVCAGCHARELRDAAEAAAPQSRPGEALRHLAMSLAEPKRDPLMARRGVCRTCGGVTYVESVREHIEEFDLVFGRSYGHVCDKCRTTFRTETLWASFARSIGSVVVLAIAWACWFSSGTTNNVLAALFAVLGVAIAGQRVVRIRNRWFAPKKLGR